MSQITGISSITGLGSIQTIVMGGTDVIPDPVNWANIESNFNDLQMYEPPTYSSKQITGISDTINITANWSGATLSLQYKITDNEFVGPSNQFTGFLPVTSGASISVANNKWVTFWNTTYNTIPPTTVTVRNASDSNTVLDTFVVTYKDTPCLLTTTIVGYFGLSDDSPELTAMRLLRDHYSGVDGYAEIIQDYYSNSPRIIEAIVAANSEATEYGYIRSTVLSIKNHIDEGDFQDAHDAYMEMYIDLKNRYLGIQQL